MRAFNHLFYIVCLTITTGILWTYLLFAKYFDSGWEYRRQADNLKNQLRESEFRSALLEHQMLDLQQTVAQLLPEKKVAENILYKNLLSGLRSPASIEPLDLSSSILEKGKKYFVDGKLSQAVREFEELKERYPASAYQVEARFFLAESLFLQREFKKSVSVIEEMVSQFPDNELTGFILLRLGQISEHNNQIEEAQEIYRIILHHFPQKPIKEQARIQLKKLVIE